MRKIDGANICVILPTCNEEEGIGPTIAELREVLDDPEYLVIDGNSVDNTIEVGKRMGARVIVQKGEGKGNAIAQVLEYVNTNTKYLVITDADFTYPAKSIATMIRLLEEKPEIGMVTGNRFNRHFSVKQAMTNLYYLGNRFLSLMQYLLNGIRMRDPLTGLRVIRYELLKGWKPSSRGFDVETEINHHVKKTGFATVEIPIQYRPRLGEKKLHIEHGFSILRRIVALCLQR